MKKLSILLALIFVSTWAFSQTSDKRIRLGLSMSPGYSWLKSDYTNVETDAGKLEFAYGINLDYQLLDNYYFTTGLFMKRSGGKLKYQDNVPFMINDTLANFSSGVSVNYGLQYFIIPIGLKLKTNEIGYLTYFANFGLNPMFNIKATGDANQLSVENANINQEVNFFNLGYFVGAGAEYALSSHFILFGAIDYNQGFIDVTANTDGREKDKTVLSHLALKLGIFF